MMRQFVISSIFCLAGLGQFSMALGVEEFDDPDASWEEPSFVFDYEGNRREVDENGCYLDND